MADRTITLRDANGTEYRVAMADERVSVNDVVLNVARLDDAAMRFRRAESSEERGAPGSSHTVAYAVSSGETQWVFLNGRVFTFEVERPGRRRGSRGVAGSLMAPMPATVRRIEAQPGQVVRRGDILIVLEAMKMELPVRAPADGTIARVNCREGELVQAGQELVELQP
jgi:biotin carboxyl carrier protein